MVIMADIIAATTDIMDGIFVIMVSMSLSAGMMDIMAGIITGLTVIITEVTGIIIPGLIAIKKARKEDQISKTLGQVERGFDPLEVIRTSSSMRTPPSPR